MLRFQIIFQATSDVQKGMIVHVGSHVVVCVAMHFQLLLVYLHPTYK